MRGRSPEGRRPSHPAMPGAAIRAGKSGREDGRGGGGEEMRRC